MEDIKLIIARNLVELRRRDGLTQLGLAERLNYSDKAVSKWERGESVPDITVLKAIADLFGVTVDYLITSEHKEPAPPAQTKEKSSAPMSRESKRNRGFITGMSILLVWIIATLLFVILDASLALTFGQLLPFVFAAPVSMLVWLILNSVWFDRRRNFLIISLFMWSLLAAIYISTLLGGANLWLIFALGVPGQAIICLWSGIKHKASPTAESAPADPESNAADAADAADAE